MVGLQGQKDVGRKGAGKGQDGDQRRGGWQREGGSGFASGQEAVLEKAGGADSEASAVRAEDVLKVDDELRGS